MHFLAVIHIVIWSLEKATYQQKGGRVTALLAHPASNTNFPVIDHFHTGNAMQEYLCSAMNLANLKHIAGASSNKPLWTA